jgi:outer membrane protein TolC
MNALAVLAGTMPGALHSQLQQPIDRDWLVEPKKLSEIPLNVMRTRPDVRSAEHALAAQVAHVGVAASLLFPKFYLNGSLGLESIKASKYLERGSVYGSIGPSVSWPIFQGGNLVANLKAEEAAMDEAALRYELAIQTAFSEVRSAYSNYTQEYHRYESLKGAVKAAKDAETISQDLYKNGLSDFNNVLDAQRSLLALEEALTVSRGEITQNLISLYKALGGGVSM